VPAIWLALASSREVSFWWSQLGLGGDESSRLDGNPVNVVFDNGVFIVAVLTLIARRFNWVRYVFANKGLFLFYAFFLLSAVWSPFPLPSVKRWVQEFGWLLIAPIILTEPDPAASLRVMFVRVSYILFPVSIPLIRFFPTIGRTESYHGSMMVSGVAGHKNSLGQLCFVFCLVLIWDLMETGKREATSPTRPERWPRLVNLGIGLYLLILSTSATSLLCFLFGIVLLVVTKRLAAMKNPHLIFALGALAITSMWILQQTFNLSGDVSEALGRGSGMSGRSEIWRISLKHDTSYLLGAGFRGFWESSEGKATYEELGTGELLSAHNGYLQTYLEGGVVGLFLLGVFLWSTGLSAITKLVEGNPLGRLAVVFWPLILVYNLTESQFMITGPVWYTMLLVTSELRQDRREGASTSGTMARQPPQPLRQLRRPSAMGGAAAHQAIRNQGQELWSSTRPRGR
jgi:O-antigen ligase